MEQLKAPPMATEDQALQQVRRSTRLLGDELHELAKAATVGKGNRKERRRQQSALKKMWRS